MEPSLKIIATYSMPYQAHLAKSRLEAEGISAFIRDEHLISIDWLYSPALGGVKLEVPEDQWEEANKILETSLPTDLEQMEIIESDPVHVLPAESLIHLECTNCGSQGFVEEMRNPVSGFLNGILLGIPYFWFGKPHLCRACGYIFRRR